MLLRLLPNCFNIFCASPHSFHLSGKQVLDSRMTFRREGVPMGLPGFSEFELWQTSEETIRKARNVLDTL